MNTLKVQNLSKSYGTNTVFADVNFEIKKGEKVGLIGSNGAGKTTLFKCLLGHEIPDGGQIFLTPGEKIGYCEQIIRLDKSTLYDELCSKFQEVLRLQEKMRSLEIEISNVSSASFASFASLSTEKNTIEELMKDYGLCVEAFEKGGGYEYDYLVKKVAFGLGFAPEDLKRDPNNFSGGQKTRIGLAKALIENPDFLFLDEPTNHLDLNMTEWLEEFLTGYNGAVLIISHDRYFLDKMVDHIWEIENGVFTSYHGNYTSYLSQKEERQKIAMRSYLKQQEFVSKTQDYINRYKAGIKSKQARGRQTRLNRLKLIDKPLNDNSFDFFRLNPPAECSDTVAKFSEASVSYGNKIIFEDVNLLIRRGNGVALVGPNGAGKTTLLKLLTQEVKPGKGTVKLGSRVKMGYFAQELENLTTSNRVLDEIVLEYGFSEERARHYLGAFLFCGDEVYRQVGDLSGGERARLSLLKLMLTGANFLLLDEPTNHLDIAAREAVEEAIMEFGGSFLVVSHDRYFLDKVADTVVELTDGRITEYVGNYSYYRNKKALNSKAPANIVVKPLPLSKKSAALNKNKSGQFRRQADIDKMIKHLETEISEMETALARQEACLNDSANHADIDLSRKLSEEYAQAQAELEKKYEEWAELVEDVAKDLEGKTFLPVL